jgi:hypothetical protein
MTLFRTNVQELITISTILIDDFVNLNIKIEIPPNIYTFNQDTMKQSDLDKWNIFSLFKKVNISRENILNQTDNLIIKLENLKKIKLNDSIKSIIKHNEDKYNLHKEILNKASDKLKDEIKTRTHFDYGFEYWNITNLVRKYNISGKELFLAMTENNSQYQQIWEIKDGSEYKCFDYVNNYGIKNCFPINICKSETKLNLRRYIDRSGIQGYKNLINLMEKKIKLKPVEYQIDIKDHENENENENEDENEDKLKLNISSKTNDIDTNNNIHKINIPSMNLEGKNINYFNHNLNCDVKYSFDPYIQLSYDNNNLDDNLDDKLDNNLDDKLDDKLDDLDNMDDMDKFKKFLSKGIKNKIFDLDKYFKYVIKECYSGNIYENLDRTDINNYILMPKSNTNLENISILNCIIFGESNIRYSDVEKLLSLIRFDNQMYFTTIDNFIIHYNSKHYLSSNTDSTKINLLEFCKYQNMIGCAKMIIQIMNEINPSLINHHNYHTIVEYCQFKDTIQDQLFNNLTLMEKSRIKEKTF